MGVGRNAKPFSTSKVGDADSGKPSGILRVYHDRTYKVLVPTQTTSAPLKTCFCCLTLVSIDDWLYIYLYTIFWIFSIHPSICICIHILCRTYTMYLFKIVRCLLMLIGSDMPTRKYWWSWQLVKTWNLLHQLTRITSPHSEPLNSSFATCNLQDLPHLKV